MALDRQEYPAMLATLQPSQAIDVLSERVRTVAQVNNGIADWLQARRRLEESYSQGLRNLARRPPIAEPQELGVFATPISALIASLDTLADTHHNLSTKIESDVETPLRQFNRTNREMTAMGNMQGNLASLSKDIDTAQKKLDKASKQGGAKVESAIKEVDTAKSQWEAQAPFVFESLQALDETRLNHLRDSLTQLQTHEVDKVERNRIAAEQCLNVLLTVETADEIKTFAMRTGGEERVESATPSRPQMAQTSTSMASLSGPAAATPGSRGGEDNRSQRSDSVSELPAPRQEKPRGLRRLGTVLGRRRESKIPPGAGRIAESPERSMPERSTPDRKSRMPNSSTFASFSRRMGGSKDNMHNLAPPMEEESERPRSPLRTVSSRNDEDREVEPAPSTNGTEAAVPNGSHQNDLAGLSLSAQPTPMETVPETNGTKGKSAEIDPITAAEQEAAEASGANPSSNAAFNVAIKDAPTTREEGDDDAFNSVANTLKMQAPSAAGGRRQGTVRGRRDNRASVYNSLPPPSLSTQSSEAPTMERQQSIPEDAATPTTSIQASQLFPPTSALPPFAAAAAIGGPAAAAGSAFNAPSSPLAMARPPSAQRTDDTNSIRSGRSLSSVTSQSHRHPDLTAPGLNASIIETVSAWFEGGKMTKAAVIGEIALQDNGSTSSDSQTTVRIANFANIDKVAPNPAFITNQPAETTGGSYTLNITQLGQGKTQVGFRYQLLSSVSGDTSASLAPIMLHPQWKVEPTQTSVILSYSLAESFSPPISEAGAAEITLKDVTFAVHLGEGSKPNSCLSKPVGTFNKERGVIYWNLGEVTLKKGETAKVLARFATEGEGKIGKAEARWSLEGAGSTVGLEIKGEEDPFAEGEGGWRAVEGRRRLVGGTYQGS